MVERLEGITVTLVEFVLELNPVETQRMQCALQSIHKHENTKVDTPESRPHDDATNYCHSITLAAYDHVIAHNLHGQIEEDLSQLRVCKGQCPESEI